MNLQSGSIQSGNLKLAYQIDGAGTPMLVLGSSVYYPRTFSNELRQSFRMHFVGHSGYAQVAGDPGNPKESNLEIVIRDTELLRQHLKLERFVLVGHSGHGYMALEYAKRFSQHVSHLVLIGMGPNNGPTDMAAAEQYWTDSVCPDRKSKLAEDLRFLPEEIAAAPERRFATFCIRLGAKSWFDFNYDGRHLWEGVHMNMPIIDFLWGDVFRDLDVTQGLEELKVPVFLAMGKFDYLVAPFFTWESRRRYFRDLTFRLFERSGHTPQLEESQRFDSELISWLQSRQES